MEEMNSYFYLEIYLGFPSSLLLLANIFLCQVQKGIFCYYRSLECLPTFLLQYRYSSHYTVGIFSLHFFSEKRGIEIFVNMIA